MRVPAPRRVHVVLSLLAFALVGPPATWAQPQTDTDADGLPDEWEVAYGLDPGSTASPNGGADDPDGDGVSNADELAAGTHPRGLYVRRLAEGAHNAFFRWSLALANADSAAAHVAVHFLQDDGVVRRLVRTIPARARASISGDEVQGLSQVFSISVESDRLIAVDRTMTWANGSGAHTEAGVGTLSTRWVLAEGATGSTFNLFYLLQNPAATTVTATVSFLRPAPDPPLVREYALAPRSRTTIWVDEAAPELRNSDVSASITATAPIVVERSMYLDGEGSPFLAGHASAAVPAPATQWFLAEGATGTFFDEFVLMANAESTAAAVQADYLLPDGQIVPRLYSIAPRSRVTVWVDQVHPWLADTAVSVRLTSLNGVPIVAERTMWWSDGGWYESHHSPGATMTGTRWLAASGEVGGGDHLSTYVLLANTSLFGGPVAVTLLYENGTNETRTFDLAPTSRFNVDIGAEFPNARERRFATLVESAGPDPVELVVECSVYGGRSLRAWEMGTNALATNLSSPLLTLTDRVVFRDSGETAIETFRRHANSGTPTFTVRSSAPQIAQVRIDPLTGRLTIVAGRTAGDTTITVAATLPDATVVEDHFRLTISSASLVRFATPVNTGFELFPAVVDVNRDGRPELAGTLNDGTGRLVPIDLRAAGLGAVADAPERGRRDNRLADLNGDGWLDYVTHTYTDIDDGTVVARLFFGRPDGRFEESAAFSALGIRGYGETIVAADFDNDGDLDLFLPHYTHNDAREHCWLLLNDGQGGFRDVADAAGVATRGWPFYHRVEGAQALDFDDDGDLDLFVASHLYLNQGVVEGVPRFVDRREALGLPARFDEGLAFVDVDNDGRLDLVWQHPSEGPQIWRFTGERFALVPLPVAVYDDSFGINAGDLNGDGLVDVVLSSGKSTRTRILLNAGGSFLENPLTTLDGVRGDAIAFGDFDDDGRLDVARRAVTGLEYAINATPHTGTTTLIEVVGAAGERNQHGRVVRIRPRMASDTVYTRVVDGGSGLMSQNEYALLVRSPHAGTFDVSVRFADGLRTFAVPAGSRIRVFSNGTTSAF